MIVEILILGFTILCLLIFYKNVFKPRRELKKYAQEFQINKFKVLNLDFVPFNTKLQQIYDKSTKQHDDCFYHVKNQWSKFDVVLCNFLDRPLIQLVSPELAKQFYQAQNQKTFRKHTTFTKHLQRMVGTSITFSQGPAWKHKRKVLTQFLNFSFIKSVTQKIESICKRQIYIFFEKNKIEQKTKDGKIISEIYIQQMIEMINSTVVAEIFFGGGNEKVDQIQIDEKSLPHFMRDLMEEIFSQTIDPVSMILGVPFVKLGLRQKDRKCNRMIKLFNEFTTSFVHNRIYQIEEQIKVKGQITQAKDLIEAFYLQSGSEGMVGKQKDQFINTLIKDFANLYTAGTDTTQHATMMMTYLINKNPQVKKKLLAEIQQNKVNVQTLTYESIRNLTYLDAILYQTLRVYQSANGIFPREVLAPVIIGGVKLEKGTVVATQTFPTHYKSDIYQNPTAFTPERWLDEMGKMKSPQPYSFNSFSNGIRSCIGKQLALQQMKLFAVYFNSKYETQFQTLQLKMKFHGFAYEPQPIKMKFWKKSTQ